MPIEDAGNLPEVVHGTFTRNWPSIQKQVGLGCLQVHCS